MDKKETKALLKKIWHFIWESDSIWSWIVNILLAFVLIKFIVYPGIGFLLSTTHPIVAVVSGSMEHEGSFDDWWNSPACEDQSCTQAEYYQGVNITKQDFIGFRHKNGFNKGDIMILKGIKPEKIKQGDVIVFKSNRPDPIIHRVIKTRKQDNKFYFQTKGDHNSASYPILGEEDISQEKVIGKTIIRVPLLGWIKIIAVKIWVFIRPR